MTNIQEELKQLGERLRVQRDELRLQAHLFKLDLKDDWARAEKKWEQFSQKLHQVAHEGAETGRELGAAAIVIGEEIRAGYERIRARLGS